MSDPPPPPPLPGDIPPLPHKSSEEWTKFQWWQYRKEQEAEEARRVEKERQCPTLVNVRADWATVDYNFITTVPPEASPLTVAEWMCSIMKTGGLTSWWDFDFDTDYVDLWFGPGVGLRVRLFQNGVMPESVPRVFLSAALRDSPGTIWNATEAVCCFLPHGSDRRDVRFTMKSSPIWAVDNDSSLVPTHELELCLDRPKEEQVSDKEESAKKRLRPPGTYDFFSPEVSLFHTSKKRKRPKFFNLEAASTSITETKASQPHVDKSAQAAQTRKDFVPNEEGEEVSDEFNKAILKEEANLMAEEKASNDVKMKEYAKDDSSSTSSSESSSSSSSDDDSDEEENSSQQPLPSGSEEAAAQSSKLEATRSEGNEAAIDKPVVISQEDVESNSKPAAREVEEKDDTVVDEENNPVQEASDTSTSESESEDSSTSSSSSSSDSSSDSSSSNSSSSDEEEKLTDKLESVEIAAAMQEGAKIDSSSVEEKVEGPVNEKSSEISGNNTEEASKKNEEPGSVTAAPKSWVVAKAAAKDEETPESLSTSKEQKSATNNLDAETTRPATRSSQRKVKPLVSRERLRNLGKGGRL